MKNFKLFLIIFSLFIFLFQPSQVFAAEKTSAKACVVFEANSGRLLFQKNKDQQLPEASTTKIMTALVVVENSDINQQITITNESVGIEGSSVYLREGEKLTIKELLYGLMLRSGNDCAVALALHVGKSIQNFASMMSVFFPLRNMTSVWSVGSWNRLPLSEVNAQGICSEVVRNSGCSFL